MSTRYCDSIEAMGQLVATQTDRIREEIQQDIAIRSPFGSVCEGGTVENHDGKNIRTLVQNRVVPQFSLTEPEFTDDTLVCGTVGGQDKWGQTEFQTYLATLRGESTPLCLKNGRLAVKNSYLAVTKALINSNRLLYNVDVRSQLMTLSGLKFTAASGKSFYNLISGDRNVVSAAWNNFLPTSAMTMEALIRLGQFQREEMRTSPFGSGDGYFIFIAGAQQIEVLRNQNSVSSAIANMTQGGYAEGVEQIRAYAFTDVTHRGFKFGIDQEPLRFNEIDGAGKPVFISPIVEVASDNGVEAALNPAWANAQYEVGFMIGMNGFKRLVPKSYVGEGKWKFAPQNVTGELQWHHVKDNACNKYGDFGQFLYQVTRAFLPVEPHAIIPVTYKRCEQDLGFVDCEGVSGLSI
jgi:hypothetical protein